MKKKENYTLTYIFWGVIIVSVFLAWWVNYMTREAGGSEFINYGTLGDTIGGLTAPVIGLISAILVFIAFKEQVKANKLIIKLNREDKWFTSYFDMLSKLKNDKKELYLSLEALDFEILQTQPDKPADYAKKFHSKDLKGYQIYPLLSAMLDYDYKYGKINSVSYILIDAINLNTEFIFIVREILYKIDQGKYKSSIEILMRYILLIYQQDIKSFQDQFVENIEAKIAEIKLLPDNDLRNVKLDNLENLSGFANVYRSIEEILIKLMTANTMTN